VHLSAHREEEFRIGLSAGRLQSEILVTTFRGAEEGGDPGLVTLGVPLAFATGGWAGVAGSSGSVVVGDS
jgi:hypothetical protein